MKTKLFYLILPIAFLPFIAIAQVPYDINNESYTTTTVWETQGLTSMNSWGTQVTYYEGNTYIVYIVGPSSAPRVKVVKVTSAGTATEVYLEPADYHILHDGHHGFAIGVDEDGYLHITGDMHNYPHANIGHLPSRYQSGTVMYWKSDHPEDITSFTWLGDSPGMRPAGFGHSYASFFNDHRGRLYYSSRSWSTMSWIPGKKNCASLSRYNADSGTWTDMGEPLPNSAFNLPTIFLEDNAEAGTSSYARVKAFGVADLSNRIHMVTALLNANDPPSGGHINTDFVYMQSNNNAASFTKADGTPIQLPARVEAGAHQADLLLSHNYITTDCSVAFDRDQNPIGITRNKSNTDCSVISYKPASGWTNHGWTTTAPKSSRICSDAMGVVSVFVKGPARLIRFWDWNESTNRIVSLPLWAIHAFDRRYLQKTGNIQGLWNTYDNGGLKLMRITITRPEQPQIELEGNAAEILNASEADELNDTDFGDVPLGSSVVKTYTIKNTGDAVLRVFNVTVEGSDFTLLNQPNNAIAPNAQTSFQVAYTPSSLGTSHAKISFGCSDLLDSRFDFSIKAKAVAALPVDLIAFNAENYRNFKVKLAWKTAKELNNDYFSIERSDTGKNWMEIGQIAGAGTIDSEQSYLFYDENPLEGLNYYRLKQLDFDGAFTYSPIELVWLNIKDKVTKVYPNPVANMLNIDAASKSVVAVNVYNESGQFLNSYHAKFIDFTNYVDGTYYVQLKFLLAEDEWFKIMKIKD